MMVTPKYLARAGIVFVMFKVRYLLSVVNNQYAIDVNLKTNEGLSPLYVGLDNGNKDIVELLLKHTARGFKGTNKNNYNKNVFTSNVVIL